MSEHKPAGGSSPDEAAIASAIAVLEYLGEDLRRLAELPEEVRIRLVSAGGQLSRPDRYSRKQLGKVLARQRVAAKREADRAVLDQTGIRLLRKEPVFRTPLPKPREMQLDAPVRDEASDGEVVDAWAAAEAAREEPATDAWAAEAAREELATDAATDAANDAATDAANDAARVQTARMCYVCKTEFHELHHFYDQMCPPCAELNWEKRNQTADLRGRVALVTGARVKIGYQAAMFLLRAGAEVVVLTRFPRDAARRFSREVDASEWTERLHIYGIDLRHTPSLELLCQHLVHTLPRLDCLINNACQTVRRPSGWYDHVLAPENEAYAKLPAAEKVMLERHQSLVSGGEALVRAAGREIQATGLWKSSVLSQVPLLEEDLERGEHLFPTGRLDQDLQQVDLRDTNSWRLTLAEVPTAELLEVHLVNAVAPFVLNARLRPLLARVPTRDAHVVNVSAMEGQFYRRWKTDKHPHTNMAKAALNMMTRTSAVEYVRDGIHMNSVDTGWVTDEDPLHHAERKTKIHGFHPPLDIVDGAARIVDPMFDGANTGTHLWGLFLKDYKPAPW
ncbi:MAG: SDR family NAD(P)-dependent oxidoreductase [Kofleriaceae bacterium]